MSRARYRARFWERINGDWVRLTLEPGQAIEFCSGGPTEEGYSHTWESWFYDDNQPCIVYRVVNHSRDCDGRGSSDSTYVAGVLPEHLQAQQPYYKVLDNEGREIKTPDWKPAGSSHRDYTAESEGY